MTTPHRQISELGQIVCRPCGAVYKNGTWRNPRNLSKEVGEDCDAARALMYPRPKAKMVANETDAQRADRYQAAIIRFINAQAHHMAEPWRDHFIEEADLEEDDGNPYRPVRPKKRT